MQDFMEKVFQILKFEKLPKKSLVDEIIGLEYSIQWNDDQSIFYLSKFFSKLF